MKHPVKVVVPLYTEHLSRVEDETLAHNMKVLQGHPVCFLCPEGLDMTAHTARYPFAEVMRVSDEWLGRKRGIQGYNEMMMSAAFYDRFADCEYILICHTDAWIFRDEVLAWTEKGYDQVAAPWPMRPRYTRFPLSLYVKMERHFAIGGGKINRFVLYGKVGNGGLCLRRVSAFRRACGQYRDAICDYISKGHNEDVFWALVPQDFRNPTMEEAMAFAYDVKPRLCHCLNGGRLPMGCHGFAHKSRLGFWSEHIPCIGK